MFRKSKVLAKIRSGGVARICCTGNKLPAFPQMAAHFGYDGVWLDAEHRAWDPREAEMMLAQHRAADVDCIWRAATLEKTGLARLLEDGASGLMIPHVSTPEKARMIVEHAKFPPLGDRGLDGAGIDSNYLVGTPPTYIEDANRETYVVAQIETPLALQNLDAIVGTEGIDIFMVGPGDLSLRLGCAPSIKEPKLRAAVEQVAAACKVHGKAWGLPTGNIADAGTLMEMGAQFIVLGNDFIGVMRHLEQCSKELDTLFT